ESPIDEEWLYEWSDGNIQNNPKKFVVHKAIGSWEYGNHYLILGEEDNTYGMSLKTMVFGPDGKSKHDGDAFGIISRSDYSLLTGRSRMWSCASGHTLFNHPSFNPATKKYAVMCGTDLPALGTSGAGGGFWMRVEGKNAEGFADASLYKSLSISGGPTSLQPLADGGFIGVFAGINGKPDSSVNFRDKEPASSIGLVRFNPDGKPSGSIKWLVSKPRTFLSYPQLVPFGDGTYLVGYAEMKNLDSSAEYKHEYSIPQNYYLMEIDQEGKPLSDAVKLSAAGWGEQDQIMPMGKGRAVWAYIKNPAYEGKNVQPPCRSAELQLSVYSR
ncbi:MAG: hypothetical protein HQK54_11145, partial [Oligoflexales bacterium]|nr:hypothetical protein [Oligoflexales bacterium]